MRPLFSFIVSFLLLFPFSQAISQQYFPLSIGDKWMYRAQYVDFEGHGIEWNDSMFVERDTTISSMQYFILKGPFYRVIRSDRHYIYIFLDGTEIPFFNLDALNDTSYSVGGYNVTEYAGSAVWYGDTSKSLYFEFSNTSSGGYLQLSSKYGPISFGYIVNSYTYVLSKCLINGIWYPTTTSVVMPNANIASGYSLHQNYPNPFNPTTTILFSLPNAQFVKLTIMNLLGQEIETIFNGYVLSGEHKVEFHAQNLTSGVYLYRLEGEKLFQTKKLILLK